MQYNSPSVHRKTRPISILTSEQIPRRWPWWRRGCLGWRQVPLGLAVGRGGTLRFAKGGALKTPPTLLFPPGILLLLFFENSFVQGRKAALAQPWWRTLAFPARQDWCHSLLGRLPLKKHRLALCIKSLALLSIYKGFLWSLSQPKRVIDIRPWGGHYDRTTQKINIWRVFSFFFFKLTKI